MCLVADCGPSQVIAQWEPTKKRDLLDFVTGSRVLPPPLSEPLRIEQVARTGRAVLDLN